MNSSQSQRRSKDHRLTDTRRRLLSAASEVVATKGISAATSRAITDAASVNLGAITYYFGSKDDLVSAALLEEMERRIDPALRVLEGAEDPDAAMLDSVRLLLDGFDRERRRLPLFVEAMGSAVRGDAGSDAVASMLVHLRERLASVIEELRRNGRVPTWIDPAAAASLIVATANGIAMQCAIDPRGPGVEAMAGQFAGLLLAAGSDA